MFLFRDLAFHPGEMHAFQIVNISIKYKEDIR